MKRKLLALFAAVGLLLDAGLAAAATPFKIVTASSRGTYIKIGQDIASLVAPDADIDLEVLPSAGSAENIKRLRFEPGVKLAIVQSDVYQAYLDQAAAGNPEAGRIIKPLRVILPLYNEEIYFIVRSDSPLQFVHEVKDARINVGELGSGTALTTTTLYRMMFREQIPERNASFLPNEEALVKLISDGSVDVVAVIAGQPARLLADMKPEARELIRLLKFDRTNPASVAALKTYFPATVLKASYPNLLENDVQGLAVKAMLVTYDYQLQGTQQSMVKFARSLCQNFAALRNSGHPKWKEVSISMPELGAGLTYYQPTARELSACIQREATGRYTRPIVSNCSQHERVLGLCNERTTVVTR
ncbi:MAG TPA: TAXI family TRAP transporter solute-binding subunit [Casimicrobiaceae bacterium]|nr:TAXI family TRAP transporter solute-binding subunit [Casimicrobiaceae bacterium]